MSHAVPMNSSSYRGVGRWVGGWVGGWVGVGLESGWKAVAE
jgi:hypothetical protein